MCCAAGAPDPRPTEDGFTLLETLIALIVASILSIGLVRFVAASHVLVRHADERLAVATLVTELGAALPTSANIGPFDRSGKRGDLDWRISSRLVAEPKVEVEADAGPSAATDNPGDQAQPPQNASPWRRYAIEIEILRNGAVVDKAETIRLGPAPREESP